MKVYLGLGMLEIVAEWELGMLDIVVEWELGVHDIMMAEWRLQRKKSVF